MTSVHSSSSMSGVAALAGRLKARTRAFSSSRTVSAENIDSASAPVRRNSEKVAAGTSSRTGFGLRDIVTPSKATFEGNGSTQARAQTPIIPLRAPAATVAACEPTSPRASSSLRAGWRWLIRAAKRLDDHWIGDLIGALCLFGMLWIGLVAVMVFE